MKIYFSQNRTKGKERKEETKSGEVTWDETMTRRRSS